MLNKKKIIFGSALVALLFIIDKLSKDLIVRNFDLYESKTIINNFFNITYTQNTGAGFSILQGQFLFFYIITVIISVYLIYLFVKEKNKFLNTAYLLVLGGAFGNFYDRLKYNYVIDFLHFNFGGYHFPIFNFADCFITIGVFIIIIMYIKKGDTHATR